MTAAVGNPSTLSRLLAAFGVACGGGRRRRRRQPDARAKVAAGCNGPGVGRRVSRLCFCVRSGAGAGFAIKLS
jgi:hypothetical protein